MLLALELTFVQSLIEANRLLQQFWCTQKSIWQLSQQKKPSVRRRKDGDDVIENSIIARQFLLSHTFKAVIVYDKIETGKYSKIPINWLG
ncbi:MAG: hypothetical protein ACI9WS_002620 [Paraglaciecola psychrophila]|jgi:hypothetical protein